jgi:preprotein translocase subunit YajC
LLKSRISQIGLVVLLGILLLMAGCTLPGTGGSSSGFDWTFLVVMAVLFASFYFFTIRPQRKRQREQQKMLNELKKGDKIITVGGIFGTIENVAEDSIVIKVESGATLRMSKSAVSVKRD